MIIDLHTHTFPDQIALATLAKLQEMSGTVPFTDGTVSSLQVSMTRSGVDRSVVLPVATSARQVVHINDAAVQINQRTPETGVLSLGGMHPDFQDYKAELRRIHRLGLKGIKLHPAYQEVDFDDIRYLRILEEACALGLVVVVHAGVDIGLPGRTWSTPDHILHVLKEVQPDKLVLAHMGGWRLWDEVEEKLAGAPVYFDTAFSLGTIHPLPGREMDTRLMDSEHFVSLVRRCGTGRVLFGTDSPWGDQKEGVEAIKELPLTKEEKIAILGGNAQKLLGWEEET